MCDMEKIILLVVLISAILAMANSHIGRDIGPDRRLKPTALNRVMFACGT
jgi:hypothetical protein